MNCDPAFLIEQAKCYQCIPKAMWSASIISLLCRWANSAGPTPAVCTIYWHSELADPDWQDAAGLHHGDYAFFLANADFTSITQLDFSTSVGPPIDTLTINCNTLQGINCSTNAVNNFNVVSPALTALFCDGNLIPALNPGNYPLLTQLVCGGNPIVGGVDITGNPDLVNVDVTGINLALTGLDASACPLLQQLVCAACLLNGAGLDITGCPQLAQLDCSGNLLTFVNISNNPLLGAPIIAYFDNNALTVAGVEHILHQFVLFGFVGGNAALDGGTNAGFAALSPAGQADFNTLTVGRAWLISINP